MSRPGLPLPWITSVLCLAVAGLHLGFRDSGALAYGPGLTAPWTLLTSHFVHWSLEHVLFDGFAFLVFGGWCEAEHRARYVSFLGLAVVLIPPLAIACTPEIELYAGLSGLAMGLAMLAVCGTLQRVSGRGAGFEKTVCVALAFLVLGKLAYELCLGQILFVDAAQSGFRPVPIAHLVGAALGGLVGTVGWRAPVRSPDPRAQSPGHLSSIGAIAVVAAADLFFGGDARYDRCQR